VVGAVLEALHAVPLLAAGREDDDGGVEAVLAQRAQDGEAVAAGQHEVEQHEVGRLAQGQPLAGLPRARLEVPVARRAGRAGPREAQRRVVLDDEDAQGAHATASAASGSSSTKQAPGAASSTRTRPPCPSAISRTMASPRPLPPVEWAACSRSKGRNTRSRS